MTVSNQSIHEPPGAALGHLRSSKSSYRLLQVEKIRANGVGDLIALPQLVVCGDQSAGKSSVLEGVTGIPFPRHDGLCTRFPTEIILRHSNEADATIRITASIRPAASRESNDRANLQAYRKVVENMAELPAIINEVSVLMKIRGYAQDQKGYCFAPDALRIEITGNIGMHLSVVDLPGLISVANEDQTEEDVDAVRDMVHAYLDNSRTIILAVLQASNDMANQTIIKMAREHDPNGERTVGIITKPDLVNKGTEEKLVRVANNEDNIKLKLGFFLLKNPSPEELKENPTMAMRSRSEISFFSREAWAGIDSDRTGALKLRVYLQELLDAHLERELPKVQKEMKKKLGEIEDSLRLLGEARPTTDHVRRFLTDLSMRHYQLTQAALEGNYLSVDDEFFRGSRCRLRATVQQANGAFSANMRICGQRRKIGHQSPDSLDEYESTDETAQIIVSKEEMMGWVKGMYQRTRGKELPGTNNSALLAELFQEQSRRWRRLAKDHVDDVILLVTEWTTLATGRLIHEDHVLHEIRLVYEEWIASAGKSALVELDKLLEDERRGPQTYNHYYTDNIQKGRFDGQKAAVRKAVNQCTADRNGKLHISNTPEDIDQFVQSIGGHIVVDMDEQACSDALSQLDAYYKVALKTFVDNVARQVIERHIITPLSQAFWPTTVSDYSTDTLLRIASEPEKQTVRRNHLFAVASGLQQSLAELRRPPQDSVH